jgi:hypothetical protein
MDILEESWKALHSKEFQRIEVFRMNYYKPLFYQLEPIEIWIFKPQFGEGCDPYIM